MQVHPNTYIVAALEASKARGGARLVLSALLHSLNYKTLTARASKERLQELTGLSRTWLMRCLAELRDTGEIAAVEYATGGRERAPVYTFPRANAVLQTGQVRWPVSEDDDDEKGPSLAPKGAKSVSETGQENWPPSSSPSVLRGNGRAAGRGPMMDKAPDDSPWAGIRARLDCSETEQRMWLAALCYGGAERDVIHLEAPSAYHATYTNREFGQRILRAWQSIDPAVRRVVIAAAPAAQPREERA